jgi:hypothetical protein
MGRLDQQKPGVWSSWCWLWWSISVMMVSWHDQYVECAVLPALLIPAVRLAIRPILVESISKTRQFHVQCRWLSQWFRKYLSNYKSDSRRWKSGSNYSCRRKVPVSRDIKVRFPIWTLLEQRGASRELKSDHNNSHSLFNIMCGCWDIFILVVLLLHSLPSCLLFAAPAKFGRQT